MKTFLKRALRAVLVLVLMVVALFAYNALRHLIYWLPTEEVSILSDDGVTLAGTLLKPDTEPPYAAVVMLHGSGPEDRSGPGYRILSNAIARSGVAVLFYDKRGVGESKGDFESALYRDFITDASAAVD
jgi:dipeptidyl aminopeptidase/acylaminoacyl peptidase